MDGAALAKKHNGHKNTFVMKQTHTNTSSGSSDCVLGELHGYAIKSTDMHANFATKLS